MELMEQIIARAKQNRQRIVLPEGTEERTLKAADKVLADGVADLIIISNKSEIEGLASQWGLKNISKATIIDPENNPRKDYYANLLFELRKNKGMTVICTGVAYTLWNKSLSVLDASVCSAFYPIQPAVSALLGILLLGETLSINFLAGSALIVCGVLVSLI